MKTAVDPYIRPIIIALLVAIAPHFLRLPAWIILWCLILWGYLFIGAGRGWARPGKYLRLFLASAGFVVAMVTLGGLMIGGNTFTGLLAVMAGLKPSETRDHRDRMVTVFIAYFIVITSLFIYENLAMTLYMLLSVLVTSTVLIHINHPGGRIRSHLRLAGIIMAQAAPLMIVLFLLFPRIQGSLWGMPRQGEGKSGFSDTLSPGNITSLVKSEEIAFRAEFSGEIPRMNRRYWRGIVFHEFDGRAWHWELRAPLPMPALTGEERAEYNVSLEPHDSRWLFALELPAGAPDGAKRFSDYTMISSSRVSRRRHYRVVSYLDYDTGPLTQVEKTVGLQLPPAGNPEARELARVWRESAGSDEEIVEMGLAYIRENNFVYTLNPPPLGVNVIDSFLFRSRKGYCEHYASSFAFLMRAAGVPARVVGGYLGGQKNPYGNYLTVRQSDAHAWVEIGFDERGWVRVDPTGAVSPERIEQGVAASLSPGEIPDFLTSGKYGSFSGYWENITYGWDAVNTRWDIWFAGYSFEQQQSLLKRIGIDAGSWEGPVKALLLGLFIAGLFAGLFAAGILRRDVGKRDLAQESYERFCQKLARAGMSRNPGQGPQDYGALISEKRPDLKGKSEEIIDLYVQLRYGRGGDESKMKAFQEKIKDFQPNR